MSARADVKLGWRGILGREIDSETNRGTFDPEQPSRLAMTRTLPRLPARAVATALLLAAGLFGSGGRAEANCGDYVVIDGQPAVGHDAGRLPGEPCHGPNCSVGECPPQAPLVPPTNPNPAPKDRWAGVIIAADPSPGFDEPVAPASCHPVRRPSDTFHPPRSV